MTEFTHNRKSSNPRRRNCAMLNTAVNGERTSRCCSTLNDLPAPASARASCLSAWDLFHIGESSTERRTYTTMTAGSAPTRKR
jgi:hypothetical protein